MAPASCFFFLFVVSFVFFFWVDGCLHLAAVDASHDLGVRATSRLAKIGYTRLFKLKEALALRVW